MAPLFRALREGNEIARMAAASTMSLIGGSSPVEPLTYALKNDEDADVRTAAVQSLGELGVSQAIESLKSALIDESRQVRSKALDMLTFLRNISAVEPLLKDLKDKDEEIRWNAAENLGYLAGGNKKAERIMRSALENVYDDIQKEAIHVMESMEEWKEREALYAETREA